MSWRCPKCGSRNADSDTSCPDCGYNHQKAPNQGGNATANTAQPLAGKWVIVCPDCGREIAVESKDSELDRCPECGNDTIESEHAFKKEVRTDQSEASAPQSPADHEKWVIACPDCGYEETVENEYSVVDRCPGCGNTSIEAKRAFKKGAQPVRTDEQPVLRPRLFIQAIKAVPEVSDKFIYHQKGRTPDFISDKIEIFPPEMEFGRNLLPEQGDYYRTISEKHCKFRCDENGNWFVSDTNSTNGTLVNVGRLRRLIGETEVQLTKDSEIQMANRLFVVFIE